MPSSWSKLKQRVENCPLPFQQSIRCLRRHLASSMASYKSNIIQVNPTNCSLHSNSSRPTGVVKQSTEPPFRTSFHLFPQLLPELRAKIWSLTLPGPRILLVRSPPNCPALTGEYATSPISYGGKHPVALHVCRESRGEALRTLTPKFNAFWDLRRDALYVEMKRWGADNAMRHVADMRSRGLLNDFKNLALDFGMWQSTKYEHW